MNFKNDILIIFSNEEEGGNELWVPQFKESLETYLRHLTRKEYTISMVSSDAVKNENDLSDNAIIIPVLNSTFVDSKSCLFALEEFIELSQNDVKTNLKGYDRIFKVCREPIDRHLLPPKIIENHLYNFYRIDALTERVLEYQPTAKEKSDEQFWFKLTDLVYDIRDALFQIKSFGLTGGLETNQKTKTVYLAETAIDMDSYRDSIKRDLMLHGYRVLPEKSLEINDKIVEDRVKKDIESAELSIHIIGNEYGRIPSGQEISIVELQNNLANEYSESVLNQVSGKENTKKFHKILWVSADPQEMTIKQKNFIDSILKEAGNLHDTEILNTPIEDLRYTIRQKLKFGHKMSLRKTLADEAISERLKSVYIIANKEKEAQSKNLSDLLEKEGYNPLITSYDGEIMEILSSHKKQLTSCDAAIILFDQENPNWLDSKIKDLIKAPGLGRKSSMVAKGIVNIGKTEVQNKRLNDANVVLISSNELTAKSLGPFFEKFEAIK